MRPQGSPRHMGRPQETPALPSRWGPSAESPGEGPRPPGPGQARFSGTCPVCPFPRRPLPPSRPSRRTMRDQTWATTLSSSLTRVRTSFRALVQAPVPSHCAGSALPWVSTARHSLASSQLFYQNPCGSRLFYPPSMQKIKQSQACSQRDRLRVRERGLQAFSRFCFGTRTSVFNSASPARLGERSDNINMRRDGENDATT